MKGCKNIERTYGPDLMKEVCNRGRGMGLRHFFYGSTAQTLERLKQCLTNAYPGLNVVGIYAPPFRDQAQRENPEVIDLINSSGADVLWIGLGSPKQDFWMSLHRPLLNAPVMVGSGAAFDFLSGVKPQAPQWMQQSGLEWLFRLCCEPRRLWRRYLVGNSLFILYVIQDFFKRND
jgi:N-acetylglucosaminyldiphosphoundecaprenol N-acetyl-beta-D-mannosaminyltransferase